MSSEHPFWRPFWRGFVDGFSGGPLWRLIHRITTKETP